MDADTKAELEKIAQHVDGYEYPPVSRSQWTTNGYLGYGTDVHLLNAENAGPSVSIIAGQHGIEPAGWYAADELVGYTPRGGDLHVIPRADPTAIEADSYTGDDGNMNRQWGTGGSPETEQVANLWNEITSRSPDLVFDLHSSNGIYSRGDGYGQCIFPTSGVEGIAQTVCDKINDACGFTGDMAFTVGNVQDGSNDKLSHKVAADLDGADCLLIETTRDGTDLADRVAWTRSAVQWALAEVGMEFTEPINPNP